MFLILSMALAGAGPLRDIGEAVEGPAVLVVATPGVSISAYDSWVGAIEAQGMDAWIFEADHSRPAEDIPPLLAAAAAHLTQERGPIRIAAHGWGGVYALLAGLEAERWALVGVPLGPQAVAGPLSGARWPWDTALVGVLPPAKAPAGSLDAYRQWVTDFPAYPPPSAPTLLIASNLDVVAPPEVVRLPSIDWVDRTWERAGFLSLDKADPLHAELLHEPALARRVARYLEVGS